MFNAELNDAQPRHAGHELLINGRILSPFTQLRRLLDGIAPGHAQPIELTIGEPRERMPGFIAAKLNEAVALSASIRPFADLTSCAQPSRPGRRGAMQLLAASTHRPRYWR